MGVPLPSMVVFALLSLIVLATTSRASVHEAASAPPEVASALRLADELSRQSADALVESSITVRLRQTAPGRRRRIRDLQRTITGLTERLPEFRRELRKAQAELRRRVDNLEFARRWLRVSVLCDRNVKRFIRQCPKKRFERLNREVCELVSEDLEFLSTVCTSDFDGEEAVALAKRKRDVAKANVVTSSNALMKLNDRIDRATRKLKRELGSNRPRPSNAPRRRGGRV